jgi:hypothetical protein
MGNANKSPTRIVGNVLSTADDSQFSDDVTKEQRLQVPKIRNKFLDSCMFRIPSDESVYQDDNNCGRDARLY